mgnify:FL=1|jgi:hypothetical protein|tara:strand:- start:44 stop:1009 length:966 start_codon:yes stop_codon:yes gene_type:complete
MLTKTKLESDLKKYGDIKTTGNIIKVLLEDGSTNSRLQLLNVLKEVLEPHGAELKTDKPSLSSVGYVQVGIFKILGKPGKKQGGGSAGLDNEKIMIDTINAMIKETGGALDVCFVGKNKKFTVKQVVRAEEMGRAVTNRAKSDVDLISVDNKKYKFSLKKDNAEYWESADSIFGKEASIAINKGVKANQINLEPYLGPKGGDQKPRFTKNKAILKIVPEIKIKMRDTEKQNVIFGNDIKANNGAVIKKTFLRTDFKYENDCLFVNCTYVYTELKDVKGTDEDPVWLIRNDGTRSSDVMGIYGLRALAAYTKRAKRAKEISR